MEPMKMEISRVRPLFWGFLFGTLGMFILAALSLLFAPIELIAMPLFVPGRFAASLFVGSEGSDAQVVLLTIFNGVLYALIFLGVSKAIEARNAWVKK
jgi:hypothetical protein